MHSSTALSFLARRYLAQSLEAIFLVLQLSQRAQPLIRALRQRPQRLLRSLRATATLTELAYQGILLALLAQVDKTDQVPPPGQAAASHLSPLTAPTLPSATTIQHMDHIPCRHPLQSLVLSDPPEPEAPAHQSPPQHHSATPTQLRLRRSQQSLTPSLA